jgi:hypothetical protein
MSEAEPFRIEVTIAAPVDAVWRALREPAQIRHWHGWDYDGLEAEIELIYFENFTESEADHTLEVQGGDRFTLTDLGGRTLLRMTRAPRGDDPEWAAYYEDVTEGWITFVQQLRFALERHPGVDRRTLFLSGQSRDGSSPLAQLGLAGAAAQPTGERYDSTASVGERLTGAVWFRSEHQTGLTVDQWGDGLLVVGETPPSPSNPHGGAMAVLSTYGLDEASFGALRSHWTDWWQARYRQQETQGS